MPLTVEVTATLETFRGGLETKNINIKQPLLEISWAARDKERFKVQEEDRKASKLW